MLLYTCPNEEQRWRPNAGSVEKPHLLGCAGMTEKKNCTAAIHRAGGFTQPFCSWALIPET